MTKKRVLAWSDSALAGTGFGVVSKHILTALHNTGKYEIHHLAINHHGEFHNSNIFPWQMQPAKLLDPKDPHGMKMFHKTLTQSHYDIVFVLNDLFVTTKVSDVVDKAKQAASAHGKKPPVFVYYYPVDCKVIPNGANFLDTCDIPVCYTKHGREETLKVKPELESKLRIVPHGVDTRVFHPAQNANIKKWRKQIFDLDDDETTLVLNVNRNSTRKQIPYAILAFKEFRKQVPNSMMYIHAMIRDQGGDLARAIEDAGLDMTKDVILPAKFSPANPAPDAVMHQIYNSADMFLTTHLGEGWGLTITEAMACGLPVVSPDNTCMKEQLGEDSERGYLYPCKDTIWVDSSGYRLKGLLPDITEQMLNAYNDGPKGKNPKCQLATKWAMKHDWRMVTKAWVKLFEDIETDTAVKHSSLLDEV
jgi:glycosyltransferase involved in cell wall biosynthesis